MFNKEDIVVIEKVSKLLNTAIFMNTKETNKKTMNGKADRNQQLNNHSLQHPDNSNEDDIIAQSHIPTKDIDLDQRKAFRDKRHQEKEKLKTNVFCTFCQESFGFTLMSKHIKQKHSEKENDCLICEKSFENKEELESHVQIHTDDVNFQLRQYSGGKKILLNFFKRPKIKQALDA